MKTIFAAIVLIGLSINVFSQTATSLSQGRKEYQNENYPEALKLLAKAEQEEPANAEVHFLRAHIYSDMSEYKQSVTSFEKAISMDSSRANWIYECGLMYYAIPDYKKSLQYIELAGAKGYKRTNDYLENLANAYVNTKQFDRSIGIYNEVLAKKPADKELRYQLAQAYFNAAKYQEAIDTWDTVLTADKTNSEALYMIGLCYQKKGEKAKGQEICDKAISLDPSLASKKTKRGGDF